MASLRDIRRHIASVKNIKQITYAMKMVAAARIKKAQKTILNSRPFAFKMEDAILSLYDEMGEDDFKKSPARLLFEKKKKGLNTVGLVIVGADKGLCGSFNVNILKAAVNWLKENRDKKIKVIAVGKKSRDFFKRLKGVDMELFYEMIGIFPKVDYVHANLLTEKIFELYESGTDEVLFIYNKFKSMIAQEVVVESLLPLKTRILTEKSGKKKFEDFDFEPDKAELLGALIPRYIKAEIYKTLLESQAAELAARMNAMENASNNALDLIEGLTLKLNKTRQAMITTELTEIVSGAEALGG